MQQSKPTLEEWWQYIAYGSSKKIFEDRMDRIQLRKSCLNSRNRKLSAFEERLCNTLMSALPLFTPNNHQALVVLADGDGDLEVSKYCFKLKSFYDIINILTPHIKDIMSKTCTDCKEELNLENQVCYGYRNGKPRIRSICKKCRSKESMEWAKEHKEQRNEYIRSYLRKSGKVKSHPCLSCGELCEKKYKFSFCSDMCRFMKYVFKSDDCWLWIGGKHAKGYGKFSMNSKFIVASRASYILFKGAIGEGKLICHTCDNPPCVNPEHLWEGTNSENQIDSVKKGRHVGRTKKVSS